MTKDDISVLTQNSHPVGGEEDKASHASTEVRHVRADKTRKFRSQEGKRDFEVPGGDTLGGNVGDGDPATLNVNFPDEKTLLSSG